MHPLLQQTLDKTIGQYLLIENVENININAPCEVFYEVTGGERVRKDDPNLTIENLRAFAKQLAFQNGVEYNESLATLSAKLPDGTRVEVFQSHAVPSGISMSLRKRYPGRWGLKDFGFSKQDQTYLKEAVQSKKTLLVSGGTSTGKTTVLEILCSFIEPQRRLIVIQDPQEIVFEQQNILHLTITETDITNRRLQLEAIAATSMRQNPDSVIIGEIRESILAGAFRQLSNTGHPGSMASIHANNPQLAVKRMANLIHEKSGGNKEPILDELKETIDFVIQIDLNKEGKRVARIEEI